MTEDEMPSDLPEDAIFRAREGLAAETIEGETVILDIDGDEYFSLNEVAGAIWSLLEDGADVDDLVDEITDTYDVTDDRARKDVKAFLTGAKDAGIVVVEESNNE